MIDRILVPDPKQRLSLAQMKVRYAATVVPGMLLQYLIVRVVRTRTVLSRRLHQWCSNSIRVHYQKTLFERKRSSYRLYVKVFQVYQYYTYGQAMPVQLLCVCTYGCMHVYMSTPKLPNGQRDLLSP